MTDIDPEPNRSNESRHKSTTMMINPTIRGMNLMGSTSSRNRAGSCHIGRSARRFLGVRIMDCGLLVDAWLVTGSRATSDLIIGEEVGC